jgi:ribonuclease HI
MQRLLLYTDGACTNNAMASKQICPTGWGVVVLLEKTEEVIAELFGQVELDPASKYYLGAEIGFHL